MTQQREDIPNLLQQVSHTSAEFIRRAGRAGRTRRARRDRRPLGLLAWVERHAALLLALLVLGYIVVISAAAIIKFQRYQMGFDLALIQQVIWNTLQGRPFETLAYDFTDNLLGTELFLRVADLCSAVCRVAQSGVAADRPNDRRGQQRGRGVPAGRRYPQTAPGGAGRGGGVPGLPAGAERQSVRDPRARAGDGV